jgi:tetratricopeptide (TPR) repeat protein
MKMMTLLDILQNHNTVYFPGAGASWDGGLPLGDEGASLIVQSLFHILGEDTLYSQLNDHHNTDPFIGWPRFEVVMTTLANYAPFLPISLLSSFQGKTIASTYEMLSGYISSPRLWLTTNFDDQIERAFSDSSQNVNVVSSRREMAALTSNSASAHTIVKLHGDASSEIPESDLGVGIEQILRSFPLSSRQALVNIVRGRPIVFIGYACRDPDLSPLIEDIIETASIVAVIGKGPIEPRVKLLTKRAKQFLYFSDGTPRAIGKALGLDVQTKPRNISSWNDEVRNLLQKCPRYALALATAKICLEQADSKSRNASWNILQNHTTRNDEQYSAFRIELETEILLRSAEGQTERAKAAVAAIDHSVSETTIFSPSSKVLFAHAGASYAFRTGNLPRARELLTKCLSIPAISIYDRCRTLMQLGHVTLYVGSESMTKSEQMVHEALQIAKSIDDPILIADASQRIAIQYMRNNRALEALDALRKMQDVIAEIGEPRRTMIWQVNLAEAHRHLRQYNQAIAINEVVISEAHNRDDPEAVMNASINLGLCAVCSGDVHKANSAFEESLRVSENLPGEGKGNALYNLGWLRMLLGNFSNATSYYIDAFAAFRDAGVTERQGAAAAMISWCLLRAGDLDNAIGIHSAISAKELIPAGAHREDYDRVEYCIELVRNGRIEWDEIVTQFQGYPESLFYICEWLLEIQPTRMSVDDFLIACGLLIESAARTEMIPILARAEGIIRNIPAKQTNSVVDICTLISQRVPHGYSDRSKTFTDEATRVANHRLEGILDPLSGSRIPQP